MVNLKAAIDIHVHARRKCSALLTFKVTKLEEIRASAL